MVQRGKSSSYWDLLERIQQRVPASGLAVAEPDDGAPRPGLRPADEKVVQAIWNEQLLDGNRLRTVSGKSLRVLDPGRWNGSGPGPDFRMAELEIAGSRLRGDIEIHVDAADWDRHHHCRDFEFNKVILHAFLRRSDDRTHEVLHNGERAECLELGPFLQPDLPTIVASLAGDDYHLEPGGGQVSGCRQAVARLDPDLLRRFLLESARERLEEKAARYAAQRTGESADQVLYQAVMAAMGHRGSKTLFFLLAKRTPIEELKIYLREVPPADVPLALESVFLHVASLALPPAAADQPRQEDDLFSPSDLGPRPDAGICRSAALDAETLEYLERLHGYWSFLSGYFSDRLIPPTRRWFDGVRPTNFPGRRLAGVARLLANFDFRRGLLETLAARVENARLRQPKTLRDFRREIIQLSLLFAAEDNSYWSRHYTLGGKPSPRRMQLIGDDRAASVLYNALLPNVLLYAREHRLKSLEEFVWRLHEHFPALPENSVTRFMMQRLFGEAQPPETLSFRFEKFNQALLHIFSECCNDPVRSCEQCVFAPRPLGG